MAEVPVPIRAHSVLCLQGFRGRGYSPEFAARMAEVQEQLLSHPQSRVRLLDEPDVLCESCPHLDGGCTLKGPDHEAHMRAQDAEVLRRLGLGVGQVVTWKEVLDRIARRVRGSDLPAICTTCPWLPLDWCAEGIDAQRTSRQAEPPAAT